MGSRVSDGRPSPPLPPGSRARPPLRRRQNRPASGTSALQSSYVRMPARRMAQEGTMRGRRGLAPFPSARCSQNFRPPRRLPRPHTHRGERDLLIPSFWRPSLSINDRQRRSGRRERAPFSPSSFARPIAASAQRRPQCAEREPRYNTHARAAADAQPGCRASRATTARCSAPRRASRWASAWPTPTGRSAPRRWRALGTAWPRSSTWRTRCWRSWVRGRGAVMRGVVRFRCLRRLLAPRSPLTTRPPRPRSPANRRLPAQGRG
jgi:hypothetical protein